MSSIRSRASGPGWLRGDTKVSGRRVTCKAPLAHLVGGSGRSETSPTAILQGTHSLEGRRSRKPHSPGPTPTSVPDSDRLPSGTVTPPTERALSMAATDWGERTPPSRKRITRSGRPYICLRCPIWQLNLSTALSYAPLKSGLTSSKVSWVGFRIAIQHIHL